METKRGLFSCKIEGCDGFIDPNQENVRIIRGDRITAHPALPCGRCQALHHTDTETLVKLHGDEKTTAYAVGENSLLYR